MSTDESYASIRTNLLAVDGQDICFYFDRKRESAILSNINIAVKPGTIYSLLGPSGCGKTTLLKCIIGQHKPQTGSLRTYGKIPGSKGFFIPGRGVGYMPQDLALYMEMTTEEILTYFGSLYGMSMKSIEERITFLVDLLELPNKKKLIRHLSGGQQRRVSFAIALIHKPPLLILDEPTVGVDPLLRKSIWDHLVYLAEKDHLAVIITTHYTEEARQADIVGLMRNGKLLVQKSPKVLIKMCQAFTLEDVFLKICRAKGNNGQYSETNIDEFIADSDITPQSLSTNDAVWDKGGTDESFGDTLKCVSTDDGNFEQSNDNRDNSIALLPLPVVPTEINNEFFRGTSSWKRLFYLTRKNYLRIIRNIPLLVFLIAISAFQITLFFMCISSDPFDLQMAVVNEEKEEQGLNKYGEEFLRSISNSTINIQPFLSLPSALESIKTGKSWAALHIGSEFSQCLLDRVLEGVNASNDTVHCSRIKLILDTSNFVIAITVYKSLFDSFQVFSRNVLTSLGKDAIIGEMLLQIEPFSEGQTPATFVEFMTPSMLLCITYLTSVGFTSIVFLLERKFGLMSRTLVAGATTTEILLSFFFGLFMTLFLQVVIIIGFAFYLFNAPCNGPLLWIIVACILSGIYGMSYGLLVSIITSEESLACLLGMGTFFPTLLLSAVIWPLEAMPLYMRYISNCLPLTRITDGTRSIMSRGWNITDYNVWDGYLICISWTVAQVILSAILLKLKN